MRSSRHGCSSCEIPVGPGAHQVNRRDFLWRYGGGLGGVALTWLLGRQGLLAGTDAAPALVPRRSALSAELNGGLHHRARAKRVVQLFMSGAASQCDTF